MELLDPPLKLTCGGCGAQQAYSASDQALRCSYCNGVTAIPRPAHAPPSAAVQAIVPLGVSEKVLLDAVYEHLAGGTLTPDDLLACATIVRQDRFYAPTYQFTGSYEAQWTASFGYDRTEHYTVFETRTENGRSRQVPVTKTRTVTDWRPASGRDAGRFQVRTYAGERLSGAEARLSGLLEDDDLGQPVPFDTSYTVGVSQEACAQSPDQAYQRRGRDQVHACIDAGVERHGQGDRQRDWHWTADIRKQHRTVLVPVCHVSYAYQGQTYNVWTSGVDTAHLVADPLPVDRSRVKSLAWGLAPLGLALVASPMAIEASKHLGHEPVAPVLSLFAAAAFAVWRYKAVVGRSMQRRQALLAARRGGSTGVSGLGQQPTATDRFVGAAARRSVLIGACVMAVLVPGISAIPMPEWRAAADEPVVEAAPAPVRVQAPPRQLQPPPQPLRAQAVPAAPAKTAEEAIVGVLMAANSKDWQAVEERLGQMSAVAPPSSPGDIDALNEEARRWLRQDDNRRAMQALVRVVAIAPQRPSAWASLTEVLTPDGPGLNALRVAVRLSTDREKTLVYLRQAQENPASENFAKLAGLVLAEIDQIPRHPKDTGAALPASAPPPTPTAAAPWTAPAAAR